jgi:hypothetical protein
MGLDDIQEYSCVVGDHSAFLGLKDVIEKGKDS